MCVSSMLPSYAAPMSGGLESEVFHCTPMFTEEEDEYQRLTIAEFGPLVPLLSHDQVEAMMLAGAAVDDEEIKKLPLLREDEPQVMSGKNENEMQACPPIPPSAPCPDNKKSRRNPPPSTEDDYEEEPSPRPSKRAKEMDEELPSPRATNKMMASCLLKRCHSAPEPSRPEARKIIRCRCEELPRGCPLHRRSRYRSWMREQGDGEIPTVGSGDGVVVPTTRTDTNKTVLTYIRWRTRVWMPTRFYVERASRQEE